MALQALNQVKTGNDELSNPQNILCGFGAGLFAKLCCHPLDVIKKRYQVEPLMDDEKLTFVTMLVLFYIDNWY